MEVDVHQSPQMKWYEILVDSSNTADSFLSPFRCRPRITTDTNTQFKKSDIFKLYPVLLIYSSLIKGGVDCAILVISPHLLPY